MNNTHTVSVNGVLKKVDLSSGVDLTNQKHIDLINEQRKKSYKKHISLNFGIKQIGLGDIIDLITTITGIKWLIKKMFKECGCEKRRIYLNKWNIFLPYARFFKDVKGYKELKPAPMVTEVLNNNLPSTEGPIPRSLVGQGRKSCGCGKKRT